MAVHSAGIKGKLYQGAAKVKKAYQGAARVYSAGNICTYHVDEGVDHMEEIDEGVSCLSPGSFIPEKDGWEFAGWRMDPEADGDVLESLDMGEDPVELYAVFRQEVVLAIFVSGGQETRTGYRTYNNGNLADAGFGIQDAFLAGAAFLGWSTAAGSAEISYPAGTDRITLRDSMEIRAVYKYTDATLQNSDGIGTYGGYPDQISNGGVLSGISIDTSKYSGFTVTYTIYGDVNFKDHKANIYVRAGGTAAHVQEISGSAKYYYPTVTVNFAQTAGNSSVVFSCSVGPNRSTGGWTIFGHTYHLTGRTIIA